MTELEILDGNIHELKEWMKAAWQSLAHSSLTRFERGELRSEMKRCSAELRRCLQLIDDERKHARKQFSANPAGPDFMTLNFRLIGQTRRGLKVDFREETAADS